jgi:hypothetical protein
MRVPFIAALVAASFAASAQVAVYQDANVQVRLEPDFCRVASLALALKPHDSHQATVMFAGREIPACYAVVGDNVVVMDAEGDSGFIPAAAFKVVPSI